MHAGEQKTDPRRGGLSGLGAICLFLAAVIVLTSTPAVLSGSISDPDHPISRVGSQLRRIAAAVPVRLNTKSPKRQQHRPAAVLACAKPQVVRRPATPTATPGLLAWRTLDGLLPQFLDLPPPPMTA
jgi:hypothetical protein